MIQYDSTGLRISLQTAAAAAAWDKTVAAFLAHSSQTPRHLAQVLELSPDFALGWAAKGMFYLLLGRSELTATAREALARAEAALASVGATPRERHHVEALRLFLAGRPARAADRLVQLMVRDPGDSLAMKLVQAIRFMLGDRSGMLTAMQAVIHAYGPAHPHVGYALGCLSFALEENGDYLGAEQHGRAGLEHARDDAWGLHSVAHVYDMTARNSDGIAWLGQQTETWAHCNNFGYHVWWHLALFHLDQGDYERVLELYDQKVRAEHTDDYRDIANGASMLVRLEIEGVDVGARWEELAALSAGRVDEGCVVFADLHYLLSLQGGERHADADRLIERIAADARRADHDMHEVAGLAGLPTAMGLAAFRAGRYDVAFEQLRSARAASQRLGGSHAQRDVFSRLLIESGIRAGRWADAELELRARVARRGACDGFTDRRLEAISRARLSDVAAE